MKIHKHLVKEVLLVLQKIFRDGVYSDKAIESSLRAHPKWGARDRHFVAESVYECVRWWRRLWHILDQEESLETESLWRVLGALWAIEGKEIPDWVELQKLDVQKVKKRFESLNPSSAVFHSVPDWLYEFGARDLGADWDETLAALNQKASVVLRVNRLKSDPRALVQALKYEDIEAELVAGYPDAIRLVKRANVFRTKAFKAGLFEVQDAASQKVVELISPQPGERFVDACAGAGGKSLHLASHMANKGKIISLDIHEWKLKELKERARRNGVDIIETRAITSSKVIKRLEGTADGLILDVPCSGLGALRRNPDTKWKFNEKSLETLLSTQAQILNDYSVIVKPGGRMVYATCSVLKCEDEQQVARFLSQNGKQWTLIREHREWPQKQGFDGFYMALLKRL